MKFQIVPESRFKEILCHLRNHFPDEPLNAAVGLCKHGEVCKLLEQHDLSTLQDGLSVMAIDPTTEEIAGVSLNGIARPDDIKKEEERMKSIDNIRYHRIFGLLNKLNRSADLFNKYGVDRIFELRILSVSSKYRGRGLAKELFMRSQKVAEEAGFKLMKTDATSYFTQRIAESLGFSVEESVRYHDVKDEFGNKIYETKSPHDYYKVMVKEIEPKEY